MSELRLRILPPAGRIDPVELDSLRADLDEHVGPTSFDEVPGTEGQKGPIALDIATLVVSLIGTPAVAALVEVIKSYFERGGDRQTVLEFSGPRGSVKLKLPAGSSFSSEDVRRALDCVLAGT